MNKIIEFKPDHKDSFLYFDPPKPAKLAFPQWYVDTPKYTDGNNHYELSQTNFAGTNTNFKSCMPFTDAMSAGYIFGLPMDLQFKKLDDLSVQIAWRLNLEGYMVSGQRDDETYTLPAPAQSKDSNVYKWFFGFTVKTPKGYSTLFTHPFNRHELPFRTFTGVVDTDDYNISVQFPFHLLTEQLKTNEVLIVKKGTPIVQMIPFKRENWSHKIDNNFDEYDSVKRLNDFYKTIKNSYKVNFWKRKSFN